MFLTLLLAGLLTATGARAADPQALPLGAIDELPPGAMDELPPVEPLPADTDADAGALASGLYVRASGGFGFAAGLHASERKGSFARSRIDNAATIGGGIGIRLTDFFRTDITIDHRFASDFAGKYECAASCGTGDAQRFRDSADLSATTALVNGYYDISEFGPLVPYVGVGLGASYLSLDGYRFRSPKSDGAHGRVGDRGEWNAAYALMAGVAFELTENVTVDFGYRFASLGDIAVPVPGHSGRRGDIQLENIVSHEVAIGLRYVFN